jgi:hypothetical protein
VNQISASNSPRLSFDRGTLLVAGVAQDAARALFGQDLWTWDGWVDVPEAKVAVARKLAEIVYRILVEGRPYEVR